MQVNVHKYLKISSTLVSIVLANLVGQHTWGYWFETSYWLHLGLDPPKARGFFNGGEFHYTASIWFVSGGSTKSTRPKRIPFERQIFFAFWVKIKINMISKCCITILIVYIIYVIICILAVFWFLLFMIYLFIMFLFITLALAGSHPHYTQESYMKPEHVPPEKGHHLQSIIAWVPFWGGV